jgi:hypothetical protein
VPVQTTAARALGTLGDPSAVMPLYEVAADTSRDRWVRQIAARSLEQLGFERREDDGLPAIMIWVAGLAVIVGSLVLATVIGPLAIVPLLGGVALIVAYYVREARKARGDWYVGPDGGDYWIPGDAPSGSGGWFSDFFGGGDGGGGGGNGGGA